MVTKIEDDLYLGDIEDAERAEHYDVVVQAHNLRDGRNEQEEFDQMVDGLVEFIKSDDTSVLVHCHAGQSRSPCVLATALAEIREERYDDVIYEIEQQRPMVQVHPALRQHALDYLNQDPYSEYAY